MSRCEASELFIPATTELDVEVEVADNSSRLVGWLADLPLPQTIDSGPHQVGLVSLWVWQ